MRVLQLINRCQRRGAEIFALDLSRELDRRGCATCVVALYGARNGGLELRDGDIALEGNEASRLERLPGWQPSVLAALSRAVAGFSPDVLQVNGSRTVKYGSLLRRHLPDAHWPLVYRSIGTPGDWAGGRVRRELFRRLVVARCDGIVAVSRRTLLQLEELYRPGVPRTVIPNAIDPSSLSPRKDRAALRSLIGTPLNAPVMIFVGSLTQEKRPDRLLRVAAQASRHSTESGLEEPELWVLGDGPLRASLEKTAFELPLCTRFLGVRSDVGSYLAAADLLLLTSDTEGSPAAVLEAACVGIPAVATDVGGVAEIVMDGATGVLAPKGDEPALANAVGRLLVDRETRRRMGTAARELTLAMHTINKLAGDYVSFYQGLLETRALSAG